MAAPTNTYVDWATGNDYAGASFTDGAFTVADMTLTKAGAFTKAAANHWLKLSDNGSGRVTAGYYKIASKTSADAVVLTTSPKSGATDPVDVVCTQATGAIGLPWRSVQGALDLITRNEIDGDQINIKAGTTQVLAAALALTTYGTPYAWNGPLILRGYSTAANDGGRGVIDGAATYNLFAATNLSNIHLADLRVTNGPESAYLIQLANNCSIIYCEIDNGRGGISVGISSVIAKCYIHDCSAHGIHHSQQSNSIALYNTLINGATKKFQYALAYINAYNNIIKVDGATIGVCLNYTPMQIVGNTIWANAGTGSGVYLVTTQNFPFIINNIIEGFSGAGGYGLRVVENKPGVLIGHNAFYNNTTTKSIAGYVIHDLTANDLMLTASPFADAANADFSLTDAGKTALRSLGWPAAYLGAHANTDPHITIGALQYGPEVAAGGGFPILGGSVVR